MLQPSHRHGRRDYSWYRRAVTGSCDAHGGACNRESPTDLFSRRRVFWAMSWELRAQRSRD